MDRNSVIGFILIMLVIFGFTFMQSKKYEKQVQEQAVRDSLYRAQHPEEVITLKDVDTASISQGEEQALSQTAQTGIYKDSLLNVAYFAEPSFCKLENDLVEVTFTTKGAQPYSVVVKDYFNYDSTALNIFNPGTCQYAVKVYTSEWINTADFNFEVVENTPSRVVMRLPYSGGGYIEQSYTLDEDSYSIQNDLRFIGMQDVLPRNVSSVDIDYGMVIPRMEKGFKNESQYSKLDYYFNGEKKPSEMGRGRNGSKNITTRFSWFAFQQQFFSGIMRAKKEFSSGNLAINFFQADDPDRNLMSCTANLSADLDRTNPSDIELQFEFYFGPNHFNTLKSYDQKYEKIIPLGGWLVGWFTRFVIIPLFNFLHRYIVNFGIIILLMTIFIKLVVLPFTFKSYSSTAKMQALKPEMERINAKYPKQDDAMKKQQATMDLYKRAGVSPMGGCLPMFLQFPILWAMFRFFPASIELRQQPFLWADDLSAYDSFIDFGHKIPLLGDHISLFALLMAVSMFLYSKMTTANQTAANDPNAASMKFMSVWMMPIMMYFICNSLSSGLSYYYLLSNLITMLETWIIKKFFVNQDEILAKVRASEGKPLPKSKWQLRLEEAQKMQQQQQKAAAKRK